MPTYRIRIGALDTWFELEDVQNEKHFWEVLGDTKLRDFMQQIELDLGEPELIREEKPLRLVTAYLSPRG